MGDTTFVTSISYVVINRNQINKCLEPSLEADESLHKWLRKWIRSNSLEMEVIKGVSDDRFIFDKNFAYLGRRMGHSLGVEEEEPDEEEIEIRKEMDFEWAAVILTEIDFAPGYHGPEHRFSLNPNELRELFSDPNQDLRIRNEIRLY